MPMQGGNTQGRYLIVAFEGRCPDTISGATYTSVTYLALSQDKCALRVSGPMQSRKFQ